MALNSVISDSLNKNQANVISKDGLEGLHVITNNLKDYKNLTSFFTNDEFGSNINQNFATSVVAENIHNGEDNIYWTASTIIGNAADFDFSSTDQANSGLQSIDCTNCEGGDQFQLLNDSFLNSSDYDFFTGWIYVDGLWGLPDDGAEIVFYNTNTGLIVSGNPIDLDDYIDGTNTGVWQRFNIPLEDFGNFSDEFDAIRITILEDGSPPNFYLDDIALETQTTNTIFSLNPSKNAWWHINGIGLAFVAAYNSTLADASMPNIPYNGLLGIELNNGITYRRIQNNETVFNFNITNLIDILNLYNAKITSHGFDGTNTFLKIDIKFEQPIVLKPESEDNISFIFADDLSSLLYFKIMADISAEPRTATGTKYIR